MIVIEVVVFSMKVFFVAELSIADHSIVTVFTVYGGAINGENVEEKNVAPLFHHLYSVKGKKMWKWGKANVNYICNWCARVRTQKGGKRLEAVGASAFNAKIVTLGQKPTDYDISKM